MSAIIGPARTDRPTDAGRARNQASLRELRAVAAEGRHVAPGESPGHRRQGRRRQRHAEKADRQLHQAEGAEQPRPAAVDLGCEVAVDQHVHLHGRPGDHEQYAESGAHVLLDNLRDMVVRKTTTIMTALGIALTVAVLSPSSR